MNSHGDPLEHIPIEIGGGRKLTGDVDQTIISRSTDSAGRAECSVDGREREAHGAWPAVSSPTDSSRFEEGGWLLALLVPAAAYEID